jgi:hypothetical protein
MRHFLALIPIILLSFALVLVAAVSAQDDGEEPATLEAPSLDDDSADGFPTPVRYLTGVGAYAETVNVNVRGGPGVYYPIIGLLLQGRSLDVTGYNGYDLGRNCGPVFELDLDMWVQVRFNDVSGWVARCTVTIRGDMSKMLVEPAPVPPGY